jgi:hypothetical protein
MPRSRAAFSRETRIVLSPSFRAERPGFLFVPQFGTPGCVVEESLFVRPPCPSGKVRRHQKSLAFEETTRVNLLCRRFPADRDR